MTPRRPTTDAAVPAAPPTPDTWRAIYAVVRRIPRGRVATYGQVAELAGLAGQPRLVGYALHAVATDDARLPWHRVINARGAISLRAEGPGGSVLQRLRLEREGVPFDARGRVDLDAWRWRPRGWVDRRGGRVGDVDHD